MADVNSNIINQAGTLLATIFGQVSGSSALAPLTTGDFISLAQKTLTYGVDPIMSAMSTLIGKTIFSVRPYSAKLGILDMTTQEFAWHNRKISMSDGAFEDSKVYALQDGQSVDQQVVNVPNVLQLNFYGENTYQDHYTLFEQPVKMALRGPEELVQFLGMITQNHADRIEQAKESFRRETLAGYIGSLISYGGDRVVHCLTEYNTATGLELTATTVMQGMNFKNFVDWLFAKMMTVSDALTERTQKFHFNITNNVIQRHTPRDMQKLVMYAPFGHLMINRVIANTFNAKQFEQLQSESVNFWQAANTPDAINVVPGILTAAGAKTNGTAVSQSGILGVLFDREALGVAMFEETYNASPYNARGRYQNTWYSTTQRYYSDHTENGVVFLLD